MSLPLETPQPPRPTKRRKPTRRSSHGSRRARPPFSDRAAMAVAAVLRLGRLLVRRELRWIDLRIAGRALLGRAMVVQKRAAAAAAPSVQTDFAPTRIVPRSGDEPESDWLPPARTAHTVEVSEEPMHTLPAELQDIFAKPASKHAFASRPARVVHAEPAETVPGA